MLNGKVQYQPVNEEELASHYSSEDSPPGSVNSAVPSPATSDTMKLEHDMLCTQNDIPHSIR